jgi:hypothetical protein
MSEGPPFNSIPTEERNGDPISRVAISNLMLEEQRVGRWISPNLESVPTQRKWNLNIPFQHARSIGVIKVTDSDF